MLTRNAVAVCALCLIFPASVFAQGFTQGDKEALLNMTGVSSSDFDSTIFSINGSLGYFFTNNIEGSVRQGVSLTNIENQGSTWKGSTTVAGDYHFDYGRLWPFVGATFGANYGGDNVPETWLLGIEGGVKFFVNSTTFIDGMIGFDWFLNNDEGAFENGQWVYTIGIGFKF
jgi:hypothetical protein